MRPIAVIVVVAVVAAGAVGLGFELTSTTTNSNSSTSNLSTSSTVYTTVNPISFCTASGQSVGPNLGYLSPLQNGATIFIKVITDQGGTIVNYGTIFVAHSSRTSNGSTLSSANYCLHLGPNATGYMPLSAKDGLLQQGSYLIWFALGYSPGGSLPEASPNQLSVIAGQSAVVTISIPSYQMITVTCSAGSCQTTTTQTARTTTAPPQASSMVNTLTVTVTVTQTITVQETAATTTVTSCSNPVSTVTVTSTTTSYSQASTMVTTTTTTTVTSYGTITTTKTDCAGTTRTVTTVTTVTR